MWRNEEAKAVLCVKRRKEKLLKGHYYDMQWRSTGFDAVDKETKQYSSVVKTKEKTPGQKVAGVFSFVR